MFSLGFHLKEDIFRDLNSKLDLHTSPSPPPLPPTTPFGRGMLDLSNSHHYKEVVNLEFTKLDLISYYSGGRSSSVAIMGKLHPFGQHK